MRSKIIDKSSFAEALEKALRSDPTLVNIVQTIKGSGESLEMCGANIFDQKEIQGLIESNLKSKKKEFRTRIKTKYPSWKRKQINKELDRRIKIFIGTQARKVKETKQVTIAEATQPVRVTGYERAGVKVKGHRKTSYRRLSTQEEMLIVNSLKRGKTPKETVKGYYDAGLPFRTETSIRRHYYRFKEKLGVS